MSSRSGEMGELNAKRIVDCVNACAGIEKPQEAIVQAREALSRALDILNKDHNPVTFQLCKNAFALLGDKPK